MKKNFVQTVPQLGVNDNEVRIVAWHVSEGEKCRTGQIICSVETTKAVIEIEAQAEGFTVPVFFVGEEVSVSQPFVIIGEDLDFMQCQREEFRGPRQKQENKIGNILITTKARRLAENLGVNLISLVKNKVSGVVREVDVRQAYELGNVGIIEVPAQFKTSTERLQIVIYGAGAGAVSLKEAVDLGDKYEVVCFVDDASDRPFKHCGLPVFHGSQLEQLSRIGIHGVAVGIAALGIRLRIRDCASNYGLCVVTIVHPQSFVAQSVRIGHGCFVKAGAIIDTNTTIGDMCIIDNGVVVAHDNTIADAVHLAPGVCTGGFVKIGTKTIVGIGSSISTGAEIGQNCIISVGTAVTCDVSDNSVFEGVPGKVIGLRKN